jgi:hypothetical protein
MSDKLRNDMNILLQAGRDMNERRGGSKLKEINYVVVPKHELVKLEDARVQLYKHLSKILDVQQMSYLPTFTGQMWRVANTKDWRIENE